jgi:hypothetical protein
MQCSSGSYVYGVGVQLVRPYWYLRIRVDAPWVIIYGNYAHPYCDSAGMVATNCTVLGIEPTPGTNDPIYIMTSNPDAPASNITIDEQMQPPSCP